VSDPIEELSAVVSSLPPAPPQGAAYLEKVRTCAATITDADVDELKRQGLSEDEIFEQTVGAAIGEGLRRLDRAAEVLR
jgi:alkylhydroperoxidase family enzyme